MIAFLRQTFATLIVVLTPIRYFSWQTVLYLSLFSWLMSLLGRGLEASALTVGLMATFAWAFLALGIGWGLEAKQVKPLGISIAPWVSGAILCLFLFGSWGGQWLQPALISWPLVSFMVMAVPNLLSWELRPKRPVPAMRQKLVILFFLCLLFSGWFQFYFRLQSWLQDYPSLMADSFDQSNFVYRVPGQTLPLSSGVTYLTQAEALIKEQVDGKPWSWVERWLLNRNWHEQELQRQVQQTMPDIPEGNLWRLVLNPVANGNGYDLNLRAIWQGPSAEDRGYYLEKTCQIMPVARPGTLGTSGIPNVQESGSPAATQWARVTCNLDTPRHTWESQGVN